jgi:hypothetical protein
MWTIILVSWFVLSFPVGIVVGKIIHKMEG